MMFVLASYCYGEIELTCPTDPPLVYADCGQDTMLFEWDGPAATDDCEGDLDLVCTCMYGWPPVDCEELIWGGGTFQGGRTSFRCDADNDCGDHAECEWRVRVMRSFEVTVQLPPP